MAHYAGVNEGKLVNAIIKCRGRVDMGVAISLLDAAKAMPIDGAGASDNIVNAAEDIRSKTRQLRSNLDAALGIAEQIVKYKSVKKKLDKAKVNKTKYWNLYNDQEDKTTALALSYKAKYKGAKNDVEELTQELRKLGNSLSAAGYPPV